MAALRGACPRCMPFTTVSTSMGRIGIAICSIGSSSSVDSTLRRTGGHRANGLFSVVPGTAAELVFTTEDLLSVEVAQIMTQERRRRDGMQEAIPTDDPLTRRLWAATAAYLVTRGERQTVIAGYPWFTDWGRDTFIALPGLCLVTGRYDMARQVIEAFASQVSQGMVPNRFPDAGERPEYNTIDASLWFVHAVGSYCHYSRDLAGVRHIAWPAIKQILDGYRRGTRFGIRMDDDGMMMSGTDGAQLTWMDAKIGDWVVTPRQGKPVEVQALWVRALAVAAELADAVRRAGLCGALSPGSWTCHRVVSRPVLVPDRRISV